MPGQIVLYDLQIKDKIGRFSLPKAQSVGLKKAQIILTQRKQKFLEDFDNHPISQEISAGPEAGGSLETSGNLFSFIGFDAGSDPVGDLRYYFESVIKLVSRRGIYNKVNKSLEFRYRMPTPEGIKKVTDLQQYTINNNKTGYGVGKSWVYGIETGTLINLDRYRYSEEGEKNSRSGTGIIRKNAINEGASFKAKKYVSDLLKGLSGE